MRHAFVLLFALCPCVLWAQQAPSLRSQPAGTVTGHVLLADTDTPARMATVLLQPVAAPVLLQPVAAPKEGGPTPVPGSDPPIHILSVQTLRDGSFTVEHVAPGAYYVLPSLPGYISPIAALGLTQEDLAWPFDTASHRHPDEAARTQAETRRLLDQVPTVTVQADLPAAIEVSLQRGAAISGTVVFEDGSPAAGLRVSLLLHRGKKWLDPDPATLPNALPPVTDDLGRYRLTALSTGEYLVVVDLSVTETTLDLRRGGSSGSGGMPYSLPLYSGSVFRTKDATSVVVEAGEEQADQDFRIPLSKLHSVSGTLVAPGDGHPVNGGYFSLVYADDRSQVARTGTNPDGNGFTFSFVPEGDYLLQASGVDVEYEEVANPPGTLPPTHAEEHVTHGYGAASVPLHITGNIAGLNIALSEPPAAQARLSQ